MVLEISNLNQNVENLIVYKKGDASHIKILNRF